MFMQLKILPKAIGNRLLLTAQCLFVAVFCALTIQIIIATGNFENIPISRFIIASGTVGLCLSIYIYIYILTRKFRHHNIIWHRTLWDGWLIFQYLLVWGIYSEAHADAWMIHSFCYSILHGTVESQGVLYLAQYPNNILLGYFSFLLQKAIPMESKADMWLLTTVVAALFADLAIYWTLKLVTHLCGEQWYTITFFICCLMIGMSEEANLLYSDIVSLWTVPFAVYQLSCIENEDKIAWMRYILVGIAIGIGGAFKPQVFILGIACCIAFVLQNLIYKVTSHQSVAILLFLIACLTTYQLLSDISRNWYYQYVPDEYKTAPQTYIDENEYPMLHWVNMGLNAEYGGHYNLDDCFFTSNVSGIASKNIQLKASIQERLKKFGFIGYLRFVDQKVVCGLQNGAFSERDVSRENCLNTTPLAEIIQYYFIPSCDGWLVGVSVYAQITYILCLFAVVCNAGKNIWKSQEKETPMVIQIAQITLLGDVLFLALFERNTRYFYTVLPLLIMLAIVGIHTFIESRKNN